MGAGLAMGLLLAGLLVGILSGMLGIGGGVLAIPLLTGFFGFSQRQAVGTSLGMLLPPIGLLAFLQYYRAGFVDVRAAAIMALAFALGAWLGSFLVTSGKVPEPTLRTVFALFMLYVAGSMLFKSDRQVWAVLQALTLAGAGLVLVFLLRRLGRRWNVASAREIYRVKMARAHHRDYEI